MNFVFLIVNILDHHYCHSIYCNVYATFACIYTVVVFPKVLSELRDILTTFFEKNLLDSNLEQPTFMTSLLKEPNNNLNFANDFMDLFSYTDILTVANSTVSDFNETYKVNVSQTTSFSATNDLFEVYVIEQTDKSLFKFIVINLAYSCKYLIYLVLSKHFKFFIKIKEENKTSRIVEV